MKVAIVDYGMGNLGSVSRALAELGAEAFIASEPERLSSADRIILPGVGSFVEGMSRLSQHGWISAIRQEVQNGKPLLGICLGMQLLASRGTEGGEFAGLDLIPGDVQRLDALGCTERIPHVGWNNISFSSSSSLFDGIPSGTDFYFVHSFAFKPQEAEAVLAEVDYGIRFAAAVQSGKVFGTQFHPEKSSKAGFKILTNFLQLHLC